MFRRKTVADMSIQPSRVFLRSLLIAFGSFVAVALPSVTHAFSVLPDTLPHGSAGTAYTQTLLASGAVDPVTWYSVSGTMPPGITVSAIGVVSGTPTTAGSYTFTVGADDSTVPTPAVQSKTYTLVIDPGLAITPSSIQSGTTSFFYSQTLTAIGGATPYTWQLVSGTLPSGITLSSSGILAGTPNTTGDFPITVAVHDRNGSTQYQTYFFSVLDATSILPSSLPTAQLNFSYLQSFTTASSTGSLTWTILSGRLPTGLTLGTNGTISGTPTQSGSYSFTVQVEDSGGSKGRRNYSLSVSGALRITPTTLPTATVGVAYSRTLIASGGLPAYTFQLSPSSPGALPPGLTLLSTGDISGIPTSAGTYYFRILVADTGSHSGEHDYTFVVSPVGGSGFAIDTPTLAPAALGIAYVATFAVRGGQAPYTWSLSSGRLPPGLTFNAANGLIAGSPTTTGSFPFTIQLMDGLRNVTTKQYTLVVTASPALPTTDTFVRLGLVVHQLVKLADDGNLNTQEDSSVYYLGTDGRRHPFPNDRVFASWYADWNAVHIISGTDMAIIPLGSPVTYKPGARMVKFTTDPKTYVVDRSGVLRWVKTEDLARLFYGDQWNRMIDDISDAFYATYSFGTDVASAFDYDPHAVATSLTTISDSLRP